MSAPALHPTARARPVLLDRLERQRGPHCWAALALAVAAIWLRADSARPFYLAAVGCVVLGAWLLASVHEDQPVWDAALPIDPGRYARIRLLCGVVGTAFLLVVVVGLYAVLFADAEHPGWYPLALFAWGLASYLLTSAALLRPPLGVLVYPMLCLLPVPLLLASLEEPAELGRMGVTGVLARTALPLGLASAAAYGAARLPARAPAGLPARRANALRRNLAWALPEQAAPRPLRRSGPHRLPTKLTVVRRHFALQRRHAAVPAATLLVFALVAALKARESMTVSSFLESTRLRWWCVWIALSWTVLVWMNEHSAQRQWNDALPVGTGERRILHATAGAAWLLLFLSGLVAAPLAAAAAAGTLAAPADIPTWLWLGLPSRALVLYLAATLVLFGTRLVYRATPSMVSYVVPDVILKVLPVRLLMPFAKLVMLLALVAVPSVFFIQGVGHLENLTRAVAGEDNPRLWNHAAPALWLVLYATAAAGAIALNDWIHQRGRLPTVAEVRAFLHEWTGTRPAPPLRRHVGP